MFVLIMGNSYLSKKWQWGHIFYIGSYSENIKRIFLSAAIKPSDNCYVA